MLAPLTIALCLLAAGPPSAPRHPAGQDLVAELDDRDQRLLAAWRRLEEPQRLDVVANFSAQVEWLDTFQRGLIAHALSLETDDPGYLPLDAPPEHYDPKRHAPGDPIPREWLKADSKRAADERARILGRHVPRRFASAWRYDWASGEVRRTGELDDPERTLRNALAGVPPGLDLAEALVLRELDDGAQRAGLAAFAHAYTDREGRVYPGLTLYDAWTSGRKMEMPDVDNLGLVHELLDDWKRWESPVPKSEQRPLYDEVARLFAEPHLHRAVRTALARSYLQAEPALRDGYEFQLDRLHALWDELDSSPAAMLAALPAADGVPEFLADAAVRLESDPELIGAGVRRRETLARDQALVRNLLLRILEEAGVRP